MSAAPFTPVGERPKWEYIYDALAGLDVGDVITYETLADVLDITRDEFLKNRPGWYKGMNRWCEDNRRALRPVNNVGYQVVDAPEHEHLAKGQHRRGRRALNRGRKIIENADRSRLSDEEKRRFDGFEQNLGRQLDMIRRLDARQTKSEQALASVKREQSATQEEVASLRDALRRHGIDPDSAGTDPQPDPPPQPDPGSDT